GGTAWPPSRVGWWPSCSSPPSSRLGWRRTIPNGVDLSRRLQPPSARHRFGTDEVGRDLFSRVLDGGRRSIGSGGAVVAIALAFGMVLGGLSGWYGGLVDLLLMRVMDVILAFPGLVLAMAVAAALGPGLTSTVLAVRSEEHTSELQSRENLVCR